MGNNIGKSTQEVMLGQVVWKTVGLKFLILRVTNIHILKDIISCTPMWCRIYTLIAKKNILPDHLHGGATTNEEEIVCNII